MGEGSRNRVRAAREARNLSQIALAERAHLTRQSLGAIEAGRSIPSVDAALRLAHALHCKVEDLFGHPPGDADLETTPATPTTTGRVTLAHISGRWVSLPLSAEGLRLSADGVVSQGGTKRCVVSPLRPIAEAKENLIVRGCAAALGLIADRLNARPGAGRFLWFPESSTSALEAVGRGMAHIGGIHLTDPKTGEANLSSVRKAVASEPLLIVTLARWEAGLLTRPEDSKRIRTIADLARKGLRIVVREPGAGAQYLLERELRTAGVPSVAGRKAPLQARGHLEVARLIAMGAAETGIATRDAALAFGLHFVPLADERYDLVIPRSIFVDRRVERFLDALVSSAVRHELASLGYDVASAGERVAEVGAA